MSVEMSCVIFKHPVMYILVARPPSGNLYMTHACRLAMYVHTDNTCTSNILVTSCKSACWLTSNPIALMSWSRVTLNVISCGSEIFSDWLIIRSTSTPPDEFLMDRLTAGGWLQGRSVRFAALINTWTVVSVTLQWTVSHWSFLLQISDCALDCKVSSAWQVVGADVDWEPISVGVYTRCSRNYSTWTVVGSIFKSQQIVSSMQ